MKLINDKKQPRLGVIDQIVDKVNYMDFDLRTPMDRVVSKLGRHLRFNQFQFIGIANKELISGIAIVDLKWVSNAFVYIYDLKLNKLTEVSLLHPFSLGITQSLCPDLGIARFSHFGDVVEISSHLSGQVKKVRVSLKQKIEMQIQITAPDSFTPLRVCSKAGYDGWVYTQKAAGLLATGHVRANGKNYQLNENDTLASYDWSCGFMRRETSWNWACLSGRLSDGRSLGLNLAAGVNETGVTENAIWVDGRFIKLGLAQFEFNRYDSEQPWKVTTSDGQVDLMFYPEGSRVEKTNILILASNFKQIFGRFKGIIKDGVGGILHVQGMSGFMEDHYAKW